MNFILCMIFGILFGTSFFVVYRLGVNDGKKQVKTDDALVINEKNKQLLEEYQRLWSFNGEE